MPCWDHWLPSKTAQAVFFIFGPAPPAPRWLFVSPKSRRTTFVLGACKGYCSPRQPDFGPLRRLICVLGSCRAYCPPQLWRNLPSLCLSVAAPRSCMPRSGFSPKPCRRTLVPEACRALLPARQAEIGHPCKLTLSTGAHWAYRPARFWRKTCGASLKGARGAGVCLVVQDVDH